jgi:hypothetical protein
VRLVPCTGGLGSVRAPRFPGHLQFAQQRRPWHGTRFASRPPREVVIELARFEKNL